MDQIDRRILQALQHDGKLQNNELAQRVGLSASPCLRRVKQLEDDGELWNGQDEVRPGSIVRSECTSGG